MSRALHDRLDICFQQVFGSTKDLLLLSLDANKEAAFLWEAYVKKVVLILEEVGRPFIKKEDSKLSQEELSLKYSAKKAIVVLAVIPGQHPPVPLPTISFISFLMDEVAKYQRSIKTVSLSQYGY